jgi:hypothetical protein
MLVEIAKTNDKDRTAEIFFFKVNSPRLDGLE